MATRKLTKQDRHIEVLPGLNVGHLVSIINANVRFLDVHKRFTDMKDSNALIVRSKAYKTVELAQSILIVGLSKFYCDIATTISDVPQSAINRKLKQDFDFSMKTTKEV
jgi:hypothetical protein